MARFSDSIESTRKARRKVAETVENALDPNKPIDAFFDGVKSVVEVQRTVTKKAVGAPVALVRGAAENVGRLQERGKERVDEVVAGVMRRKSAAEDAPAAEPAAKQTEPAKAAEQKPAVPAAPGQPAAKQAVKTPEQKPAEPAVEPEAKPAAKKPAPAESVGESVGEKQPAKPAAEKLAPAESAAEAKPAKPAAKKSAPAEAVGEKQPGKPAAKPRAEQKPAKPKAEQQKPAKPKAEKPAKPAAEKSASAESVAEKKPARAADESVSVAQAVSLAPAAPAATNGNPLATPAVPEAFAAPKKRNYRLMNSNQLRKACERRGLDTEGTLDELRARLQEADDAEA